MNKLILTRFSWLIGFAVLQTTKCCFVTEKGALSQLFTDMKGEERVGFHHSVFTRYKMTSEPHKQLCNYHRKSLETKEFC